MADIKSLDDLKSAVSGAAAPVAEAAPKHVAVRDKLGRTTIGDIGWKDEEGYLYLTDRQSNMIISGGVNIYPQETEDALMAHPAVHDVAVIGVPNEEFGEEVKAVVQPADPGAAGPALAEELIAYCRANLSHIKCPKSVDFEAELITPIAMEKGVRFAIREGGLTVGAGAITEIIK